MKEMRTEGKQFGVEQNARSTASVSVSSEDTKSFGRASSSSPDKQIASQKAYGQYSFPVKRDDFLFITSPFGMRQDPMDKRY